MLGRRTVCWGSILVVIISREGDNYLAYGRYLSRVRGIIISRTGHNYFAHATYYFAQRDLLFRGKEIFNLSF